VSLMSKSIISVAVEIMGGYPGWCRIRIGQRDDIYVRTTDLVAASVEMARPETNYDIGLTTGAFLTEHGHGDIHD
jgi:hypothetical protein